MTVECVRRLFLALWISIAIAVPSAVASGQGVDLATRLRDAEIHEGRNGLVVTVRNGSETTELTAAEYVRAVHDAQVDQRAHGTLYYILNISNHWGILWVCVGFLGQALFTFRMVLQWMASERAKRSIIPVGFWWGSLFGGMLLLVYFVWRRDIVGIVGQTTGVFVYARNLVLIYGASRMRSPVGATSGTA
jgi:lipid-A-disaccharide synthase-like uncharacterized protein